MKAQKFPLLTLTFSNASSPKLLKSELRVPGATAPIIAAIGREKDFTWTQVVKAVCLLWIRYVLYSKKKNANPKKFGYEGLRNHPAKSVADALEQNPAKYHWLQKMYGEPDQRNKTKLHEYILREDANLPDQPFILKVNANILPPSSLKIILMGSGNEITKPAD